MPNFTQPIPPVRRVSQMELRYILQSRGMNSVTAPLLRGLSAALPSFWLLNQVDLQRVVATVHIV